MRFTRSVLAVSALLGLGIFHPTPAEGHISERVQKLVQEMSLKDKAGQMVRGLISPPRFRPHVLDLPPTSRTQP